jgi:hypothetical protein
MWGYFAPDPNVCRGVRVASHSRQLLYQSAEGPKIAFAGCTKAARYLTTRHKTELGGSSLDAEKRWRLAAAELEQTVVVSAQRFLEDQAAIATTLQEAGLSSAEIQSLLKAAEAKSVSLGSRSQPASTIAELVERVDLRKNGIEISMNLESLLPRDSRPTRLF